MYQSLEKNCSIFHLYIFAFDDEAHQVLTKLMLKNATVISLKEFESEELLSIKPSRTAGEYCWTCTPATILYCIQKYQLNNCTYVDSDLLFFADPKLLIDELGADHSVLITDHRYTPEYDQTETSGKYCVQFITFKNATEGLLVLNWWYQACLEWCFNRMEDNKFGDQKYLDDWSTRFKGVHELKHLGGGVAPWNTQQYTFSEVNKKILGTEISTGKKFDLIFYHYHGLKYCTNNIFDVSMYNLNRNVLSYIYKPYIRSLKQAEKKIVGVNAHIASHEELEINWMWRSIRRTILVILRGYYKNYYHKNYLLKSGLSN
ncbi:MAG: glycosyl transferase [Daejeonella sp.]